MKAKHLASWPLRVSTTPPSLAPPWAECPLCPMKWLRKAAPLQLCSREFHIQAVLAPGQWPLSRPRPPSPTGRKKIRVQSAYDVPGTVQVGTDTCKLIPGGGRGPLSPLSGVPCRQLRHTQTSQGRAEASDRWRRQDLEADLRIRGPAVFRTGTPDWPVTSAVQTGNS